MKFGPVRPFCLPTALVFTLLAAFVPLASAQESLVVLFTGINGNDPTASLISDGKGNFYGTTYYGGTVGAPSLNVYGTVFELSPAAGGTWTEKVLWNFGGTGDGTNPSGTLVFDAKGNLYGTTAYGGATGNGTVFELSPAAGGTWVEKILYSFAAAPDGNSPKREALIFDSKGNLYGTTRFGGPNTVSNGSGISTGGTVFELSPAAGGTWTEKILYSFGAYSTDGANPLAGLIFDASGHLFGTTAYGGTYNSGTVFELSPAAGGTWTEKLLHSFDANGADGALPAGTLIFDSQGNLYGTTYAGGPNASFGGLGSVFELSPSPDGSWTVQILHGFTGQPDGDYPFGPLIFDAAGNLYGTTSGGGTGHTQGTVFELTRSSSGWTEKILYNFGFFPNDGYIPYGGLSFDAAGNLYGTTTAGGTTTVDGTIFKIANVVTASPQFSPGGGAYTTGQTVKITDATAGATIYYSINGSASSAKYTAPISVSQSETISAIAVSSALPPSQTAVANYQIGTIAATPEFLPAPGTYALAQFVTLTDAAPGATIYYTTNGTTPTTTSTKYTGPISVTVSETIKAIAAAKGYTNSAVGSATYTITPIVPATTKVLYSFGATATDGNIPLTGLISDGKGNLYGTTEYGGTHQFTYAGSTTYAGTVFELSPGTGGTWTEKGLYDFGATSTDGAHPLSPLVLDSKGNLYGTTYQGGTWGLGTAFELSPGTGGAWTEKVLHSFGGTLTDGEVPEAGLIFDSKGNLYGTTEAGGAYDNTYAGASNGLGTVFELSPGTGGAWTEKVLYSFSYLSQTDGYYPMAGLVFDSKGNLYGTTSDGGSGQDLEGGGTVFELSPVGAGWTEKVLYSFGGGATNGYRPLGGVIVDSAGNLYGTDTAGGNGFGLDGTLFELSPVGGGWALNVLHSFGAYTTDGINPTSNLIMDANGNLYGTTNAGGAYGAGMVFELKPGTGGGGWTEDVLHSFDLNGTDGANPYAGLIFDALGNLYGTTEFGGTHGSNSTGGTVFEIESGLTKATTKTILASSLNPSVYGQSITLTATVKPEFVGTPAGTVTFKDGTTTLGTVTLAGGVAKYSTSTLAVGSHSITAVYNSGGSFAASTSATLKQVVNQATTTTTLASSQNPSTSGQSVTFTATVKPQFTGTPTGSVTFKDGATTLGAVTLSAGVGKYITSALTKGTHSISATYDGDTNFKTSTVSLTQTVN